MKLRVNNKDMPKWLIVLSLPVLIFIFFIAVLCVTFGDG